MMARDQDLSRTVCVRLEPDLVEALQALADAEDRPLSQFLRRELRVVAARWTGAPATGKKA